MDGGQNTRFPNLINCITNIPFWCATAYSTLDINTLGYYSVCCRSIPFSYHIDDVDLYNHYNSSEMNLIRKEFISGYGEMCSKYCHRCKEYEDLGLTSYRQFANKKILDNINQNVNLEILDKLEQTIKKTLSNSTLDPYEMGYILVDLQTFGTTCNLKCIMCNENASSSIAKERNVLPKTINILDEKYKEQWNSIQKIFKNSASVKIIGGEPMLMKGSREYVKFLIDNGYNETVKLKFVTNGTNINLEMLNMMKQFKRSYLCISVDSFGDLNSMQRRGSNFYDIIKNIDTYIKSLPRTTKELTTSITNLTVSGLHDICSFGELKGLYVNTTRNVTQPKEFDIRILPDNIKQKYIKKLESSCYKDKFKVHIAMMKSGTYDPILFKKYLNTIITYHGRDKILKNFPEYKDYV